jgi:DNA invertase Pin-like site-specific DNA recombinase
MTTSEQAHHAIKVLKNHPSLEQDGPKNHRAKLTVKQVKEIKERRSKGEKLKSIAKDYGVTYQTVSKIARGDRWKVFLG